MRHLFCNRAVHVILSEVSGHCIHTIYMRFIIYEKVCVYHESTAACSIIDPIEYIHILTPFTAYGSIRTNLNSPCVRHK